MPHDASPCLGPAFPGAWAAAGAPPNAFGELLPEPAGHRATLGNPLEQPASGPITPTRGTAAVETGPASGDNGSAGSFTGSYTTLPRPVSDPVTVAPPGPQLISGTSDGSGATRAVNGLFDNLSFFAGLDGSKEPADLGVNANLGYRLAVNWGFPIFEEAGIGIQVGSAVNHSENAVRVLKFLDGTVERWQSFTTVGLFQRSQSGFRWGVVYDFRFDDYYDRTSAGQWRAQIGMETSPDNEFGVWATIRNHGDEASIGPYAFAVEPISQWNFYWRHIWTNEIVTRFWCGVASDHSRFNPLIPGQPQVNHPFTFGSDIYVPLTDHLAIFGEAHFITPNDSGTVTATLGFAWYPGSARGTARSRFAPLLPLANNTTFALDVR